ncbi:hypothetical protein [uncultured Sulfitobacter sp.]|uniref:hypothetical protein n=1 Tax=uncultured Sulfitobacter sp. TaxID=191468 RepID=UPI00259566BA|nr:hypothetical protein [uncultured Sulfitobacter sp.]
MDELVTMTSGIREIKNDLRAILMQRLLRLALCIAPEGETAINLAESLHWFHRRELGRLKEVRK